MIADKIKQLRTSRNMTQSDLAKKLNITRSSVNAWEMGLSTPSTAYLVRRLNRLLIRAFRQCYLGHLEPLGKRGSDCLRPGTVLPRQEINGTVSQKVGQFHTFFRVRQTPAIAPIKANGAILTNSHSNAWNADPATAVSGSR